LNPVILDEKILLEQLINNDQQAFKQIYFLYSGRLYGNILKLVKSEPVAQEILQDVFIKIWDHRHSINTAKSFHAYLFRIAENMVCNFYKKASRDKVALRLLMSRSSEQYCHIEEEIFCKEEASFLSDAIGGLPPQRRQVFELCKMEGKSYDEVSRLLGISVSTISDHIVKANRFLKEYYFKNNGVIAPLLIVALCMTND
jgi:RNA polymerase sigma-70 factor (family 1)